MDGTAVAPGDYTAILPTTLTFAPGDTTMQVTVSVNGDPTYETNETFTVHLSNASGATISDADGTGTIKNDDAAPSFSIDDVTQSEGNTGTTSFTFTVTKTGPTEVGSSVTYETMDGTAVAPGDFTAIPPTILNFAAGDTQKQVTVFVNGDTTVETDETFKVHLSAATDATITDADGTGTIVNDDTDVSVTVSSPTSVPEDGAQNLTYTFTRSPQTSGDVTVNFAATGTADPTNDYTVTGAASFDTGTGLGTVVIPNGQTTATVTIDPTADNAVEPDETVVLTVASGTGYNVGTPAAATGTIVNDDASITVSVSPAAVAEDGAANLVYTFTRNPLFTGPLTVSFSVGGTATFSSDYVVTGADSFSSTSGSVTFADGSNTTTVTVDPTADSVYELNETVILTVGSGTGYSAGSPGAATGTITNDDAKPTLTIGDRIANEGNTGTTNFVFTVTKSGSTDVPVTVNFATADGVTNAATGGASCGPGVDYVTQSGMLTFPATGTGSTSQTITVSVCGDTTFETNETFFVELSGETDATLADGEGRGTIQNDDAPPPISPVNTTNDVNDGVCNATHCSLREAIITANGSASAVSITFAIPATDPRHFYYKDDGIPNHVTNDGAHVLVTTAPNDASLPTGTDPNPVDPDWPHSWYSILPTSALPALTQTATIDGYTQPGATTNTATAMTNAALKIEIDGASAVPSNGLSVSASAATVRGLVINRFFGNGILLSGGSHSVVGNFIGTDVSGTIGRGTVGNLGHGIATSGFSEIIGGSTPADANLISGNGANGIYLFNSNQNTILGNYIGTAADGTTAIGNANNGLEFTGGGTVFNILGGTQSADRNVIAFNGGDGAHLENAGVSNSIRGNSIFSNGTTTSHLGIDLGPDGVTPNDPPANKDSDSGPNGLQNFPVITSALVTGSTKTIKGTLNSVASENFDIDFYANASCDTAGNGEGQTYLGSAAVVTDGSGDASFTFHPDASQAGQMTVGKVITATASRSGMETSEFSACFTVADGSSGAGDIQFTSATYSVGEAAGTAAITVARVGGSNGSVTAMLSTSNGTATAPGDYTAISNFPITYSEGETGTKTVNVTTNNDSIYETNETVNLSLSTTQINSPDLNSTAPDQAVDPHAAVLTIVDNDPAPSFAIDDVSHNEGNSSTTAYTFTVTKTGATEVIAKVDYNTVNGTATAPSDYTAIAATTLTFQAADATKQFTIQVNGDTTFEPDEAFTVHLSTPVDATISDADGTGTIVNDDAAPTPTATATATATPTSTPTATATSTPSATATSTPTATATSTPTATATVAPTATATATATATPKATATATATATPTATATATPTATPTATAQQTLNIATRLRVETGDNAMIAGFIITGNSNKNVVVRGMGPSLAVFGLTGLLQDPVVELRSSNSSLFTNDNWKDTQRSLIEGTNFQPSDDRESVIIMNNLPPANYTATLTGKNNTTGLGLVEVYDNNPAVDAQLGNISTRGLVQGGNNVMIGGFILGNGSNNSRIVVRGLGPSLSQFGLNNVLADPTLELRNADGTLVIVNDNWTDDPVSAAQLTANGFAPQNQKESGIFTSLPAGQFTAILAGKNGSVGIGLVEIYNLQ
jgi:CSLREA domain-containing protein